MIKTSDFMEGWQDMIMREMSEGASRTEIYGKLNLSNKTFSRLLRDDREFFLVIKEGERLSEGWWLEQGRKNLENKNFSAVLWYMNMKNRFGWKDKTDITSNNETVNFTNGVPRPKDK